MRRCYRVAGSPQTWHQQLLAACLASSGANAVSFRAAAQLWDLPGGAEIVELTAPRHRRMQFRRRDGPRELLPHRPRRHVSARNPRDPAGARDLRPGAPRRTRRAAPERRSSSRCRRRSAGISSICRASGVSGSDSAASCGPAAGSSTSSSATSSRPFARPTARPSRSSSCCSAPRGSRSPSRSTVWTFRRTRWVNLDFAWPEAKVYCEFDPYKWHGGQRQVHARHHTPTRAGRHSAGTASRSPTTSSTPEPGSRPGLLRRHLPRAG